MSEAQKTEQICERKINPIKNERFSLVKRNQIYIVRLLIFYQFVCGYFL